MTRKKEKKQKTWNQTSKITQALRKVWRYSPMRQEALLNAKDLDNPKHYICECCKNSVRDKLCMVDHKNPVVDVSGFLDWNTFINRLFCDSSELSLLCESCHKIKTLQENSLRKLAKKASRKI